MTSGRCLGPGCNRLPKARGLCDSHLQQFYRTGTMWPLGQPPVRMVVCADCEQLVEHYAKDRCNPCYQRYSRARRRRPVPASAGA